MEKKASPIIIGKELNGIRPSQIPLMGPMHTRGKQTLFQSTLDMMWHMRSFVASRFDVQEKNRDLKITLTSLYKNIPKHRK